MNYMTSSDYGIVGNHFSSALISHLGSVDWCCFPYLDSPSHFSALMDPNGGGRFQIVPQGEYRSELHYLSRSQVLEIFFETPSGRATLRDWMPMDDKNFQGPTLCRRIEMIEGQITWTITCSPRFRYGSDTGQAERHSHGILFRGSQLEDIATLYSEIPLEISANGSAAQGRFQLEAGQAREFVWAWGRRGTLAEITSRQHPEMPSVQPTLDYWRKNAHHCPSSGCLFGGPWHDVVSRSGLVLKLVSTSYSGSVAESIVCSTKSATNPGIRNWSPRSASVRDGALILQALTNLGYTEEAKAYFVWLSEIIERDGVEGLQAEYTLDGGRGLTDPSSQQSVSGYISHPFQLDIYGHVILTASEYYKIFGELSTELWNKLVEIADYLCQAWKRPDHGRWSTNLTRPEHFVISKLFCWAAFDQMIWLAKMTNRSASSRWATEKANLHRLICDQGYDESQNSFVSSFGSREIDTSCLWIPVLNFLPPDDYRVQGSLDAVLFNLSEGALLRRSRNLDTALVEERGAADLWSSFFAITCLSLCGRTQEATDRLAEVCTFSNPLGLFGDQINLTQDEIPHRFPSTAVHLAVVNASLYVAWARGRHKPLTHLMGSPELESAKSA
jgi:alpha,alpha-trehalase